ncbi:MAG: proline--tRNA ligase [Armatimonadetes bacterium]|nr:proline--tRNA ligase [Armatimonadota bacterium]
MSSNLGIPTRENDYAGWYNELVIKADLVDQSPVRGCMVIKPHGFAMWELMQRALDDMIKETGHSNAYFPLLIPKSFFDKEADHVDGFAKECAVVTHHRLKKDPNGKDLIPDPEAELEEPFIIRPTSETIIWNSYKKWIQSYRDLPILINQWANVMRWELRTRAFLRSAEFLWQEGHTAHATFEEAEEESLNILHNVYAKFAEEWMAVPVFRGLKTENEKFAGADHSYCIEAMTQDRRAIQAGTSHHLGQNFAKAFDVQFQSAEGKLEYVYATSWGVSTRLMGTLIMAHSDDKGLVCPPKLAPIQVVFVPMGKNEVLEQTTSVAKDLAAQMKARGLRVKVDDRAKESPGFKAKHWEMRGVCIRVDVGGRELEAGELGVARRDNDEKTMVAIDKIVDYVVGLMPTIQQDLFDRAKTFMLENTIRIDTWEDFQKQFDGEGGGGFVLAHWDGTTETEEKISDLTKATIRCIPLEPLDPSDNQPGQCVMTGKPSKQRVIFAKAY